MTRFFVLFFLVVSYATTAFATPIRIKDLVEFDGVRGNDLVGYGLIVGLKLPRVQPLPLRHIPTTTVGTICQPQADAAVARSYRVEFMINYEGFFREGLIAPNPQQSAREWIDANQ